MAMTLHAGPPVLTTGGELVRRKFLAPATVPSAIHPPVSLLRSPLLAQSAVSRKCWASVAKDESANSGLLVISTILWWEVTPDVSVH